MKDILYFHLSNCPHCKKANSLLEELIKENPAYGKLSIKSVEEKQNAAMADKFDYFYVPCFYVDGKKEHEGTITKAALQAVLDSALAN